jgi:hypothetical protein
VLSQKGPCSPRRIARESDRTDRPAHNILELAMTTIRLLFFLLACCCVLVAAPATADAGSAAQIDEAQALYEQGDFKAAYKQYLKRAKKGDTFAQYRVSYMHAMGLGADIDPIESLAWAVLATEAGPSGLGKYQDAIAALVPEKERRKAQKKTDTFRSRWDRDNYGSRSHSGGGCTGTRLSANCGGSTSVGGPRIPWGEDFSADPAHKQRVEELNESILVDVFKQAPQPAG